MSSEKKPVVQETSNAEFINLLREQINNGGGFVPFIGSGCSSPSGILMGVQFDEYLSYTAFLCVAETESIAEAEPTLGRRWNLRSDGWPKEPTTEQVGIARKWIRRQFDRICDECGFRALPEGEAEVQSLELVSTSHKPEDLAKALTCPLLPRILRSSHGSVDQETLKRLLPFFGSKGLERGGYSVPGISPTSEDAIIERAIRALYDWRATLNFLSELKLVDHNTLLIEEAEQAVIDGFNVHITRGRKPNLIHNMLCHLAGPARFRVILTTNFDSLIEDAFREMKERVEVISVSIKGGLPDPEIVHARNTVVKMHGTLSETRADFSLDESPSRENKRRFFHYVRGSYPDQRGGGFLPVQLLVCGYSGADNRCVEMIKYVLDAGAPEAHVYWVCHTKADLERVNRIFRESAYRGNGTGSRVIATVTERCDLLLYELFQRLCLSLPGGGPSYQYSYHVPPDVPNHGCEDQHVIKEAQRIVDGIGWFEEPAPNKNSSRKLLVVDGKVGVLATLRKVLQTLTTERKVSAIWLELQDYQDTYCVAYEFLQIVSNRLGLFQLGYADLLPERLMEEHRRMRDGNGMEEEQRATEKAEHETKKVTPQEIEEGMTKSWYDHIRFLVDHYFGIVPGKWVIVLYGRKGPGGCAGWDEKLFWKWEEEYGTEEKAGRFPPFVRALCQLGFHVIYAPYSEALRDQNQEKKEKLEAVLKIQFPTRELTKADEKDYPDEIPIHRRELLESAFASSRKDCGKNGPQENFPGAINHRCEWPDSLGLPGFDRSMKRLFENWISTYANRHALQHLGEAKDPKPAAPQHSNPAADDRGASDRHRHYLENLQFLYAVTLFRRARHYSSFLGEGVLPATHIFSVDGYDNDWERDKKLAQHLADLNEMGFFYRKPGGFAWTYRDFRLGVRRLIDSLGQDELEKHHIEPFVEWRSHYHYWIADWYLRAFYTSGHAVPLMEGIYHLYQTILHLDKYRKQSTSSDNELQRAWQRYRLWRRAACDMAKALRVGNDAICLWFGPPLLKAWFPPDNGKWLEAFTNIYDQLNALFSRIPELEPKGLREHSRDVLEVLKEELLQLARRGGDKLRIRRFEDHVASESPPQTEKDCELDKSPSKDDDDLYTRFPEPVKQLCGDIKNILTDKPDSDSQRLDDAIQDWQHKQLQEDFSDRKLFYLAQQLNERAFLFLRDAKLRQLVNLNQRRDKKANEPTGFLGLTPEVKHRWICVTILTRSALEFCRLLHPKLGSFEGKERVKALCLYGVALARLYRFYEAHRRLNEANALLSKINVSGADRDVLLGILELRRAEAHLLEGMLIRELREKADPAESIDKTAKKKEDGMSEKEDRMSQNLFERYAIKQPFLQDHEARLGRLRVAKLDDAWCALERAERLLSGRLRSSHWWSRLCVLKLRCLAEHSLEKEPKFRPLARRIQSQPLNQIYELLYKGLAGCQEETRVSSRLRLVDLALRTAYNLTRDDLPLGEKALNTLTKTVDSTLKTVKDRIKCKEPSHDCPQIKDYVGLIEDFLNDWHGRQLTTLLRGRSIGSRKDGSLEISLDDESKTIIRDFLNDWQNRLDGRRLTTLLTGRFIESLVDSKNGFLGIGLDDEARMIIRISENCHNGNCENVKIESVHIAGIHMPLSGGLTLDRMAKN
jgi:hypothetical protein